MIVGAGRRVEYLAKLIVEELRVVAKGHCARVDHLDRNEAEAICREARAISAGAEPKLGVYVLAPVSSPEENPLLLATDRAVELRNRKRGVLCVFVPSDLVDATASSLGNSFAQISGRELHRRALDRVLAELSPEARELARRIQAVVKRGNWVSDDQMLDMAVIIADREQSGELETVGRELWRVGLIADGRADFAVHLSSNRRNARILTRPQKLASSFRDRIASMKVSEKTARELETYFARRPIHDIRNWSRELAEGKGPTLDLWVFPEAVRTNLQGVQVLPFTDEQSSVVKKTKLIQPDGPGGALLAQCGEKQAISCWWETEPLKPNNVHGWQVSLVAAGEHDELEDDIALLDLPAKEVKGNSRTTRIKLELEFGKPPESSVWVRVAAIDESGNEVADEKGEPIAATSEEFYLTGEQVQEPVVGPGQRRRTVPSIAEGRLQAAMEARDDQVSLTHPGWSESKELSYFSIRANQNMLLNVAASPLLLRLEGATTGEPQSGGRWQLELNEVGAATWEQMVARPVLGREDGPWGEFWRARSTFFERLRRGAPRDRLEAADWTGELMEAALRYGRSYGALLTSLRSAELREALTVDTLTVKVEGAEGGEAAVVVLPTHPLRVVWQASHGALLKRWEEKLLQAEWRRRRGLVDLELVRDLSPMNMPAFAWGTDRDEPFLFFRNLGFYHGVALPADAPDPLRRFQEVAEILGFSSQLGDTEDRNPERLASHLEDFRGIHPYADPLRITLINPDQGELIAAALDRWMKPVEVDGEEEIAPVPVLEISAYTHDDRASGLRGLDRLRTRAQEGRTRKKADHLQPAVATSVRALAPGKVDGLQETHVAIVSDLSRPKVGTLPLSEAESMTGSLSLYGLIARFVNSFSSDEEDARWQHTVATSPAGRLEAHPAGQRYGDTLVELQSTMLKATGRVMSPTGEPSLPCLRAVLDRDKRQLIEGLHQHTDWVITLDRFLGVDYYDSPLERGLDAAARKYLIDYSPEFSEGLGHRMIVTTAWREEAAAILRRAMTELGFAAIDRSVGQLLHYLKTVSGRLALKAMSPASSGTAAVSLGAVLAWLQAKRRLEQAILVPVDSHLGVFGPNARGLNEAGQRRCDLALFTLRRGIVDATFVEVKWRRGPLGNIDDLAEDMGLQMRATGDAVERRYFDPERPDGALQRAQLANVLRFYCARAQRYGLMERSVAISFLAYLAQFEKSGLDFRPSYEGYIVSLEDPGRRPLIQGDATVTVLTARDFEQVTADLVVAPREERKNGHVGEEAGKAEADQGEEQGCGEESETEEENEVAADPGTGGPAGTPTPNLKAEGEEDETERSGEVGVLLGESAIGDVVWRPSIQGSPHLFITGIPGQGKSVSVVRLLTELSKQGVPALVLDFHGDLGSPDSRYVRVAQPAVMDAAIGLPFSPFECSTDQSASGWNATAMAVSEIFAYVCGLGDIQRDALFTSVRDAYRSYGFGPGMGQETREYPSLQSVLKRIERAEQERKSQNLLARCRPLLEMDIFCPPEGEPINLMDVVAGGLVVDLHRLASETLQMAAGAFLLRKIYRDMFQWGEADRLRVVIVLDEAHRLSRDVTLPKIMKEGRKFGVAVVAASQGLGDFHPAVLGNAGTKVAFRANYPDSRKVAGFFRGRPGQDLAGVLEGLSVGSALVQTPELQVAVRARMLQPA